MNSKTASQPTASARFDGFSFGDLFRRPEAGAFLGLLGVFVFFLAFGSADFLKPAGAASWLNVAANLGIVAFRSAS